MLKYLFDKNIVIYTMRNRQEQVKSRFKQHVGQMCKLTRHYIFFPLGDKDLPPKGAECAWFKIFGVKTGNCFLIPS